MVDELKVLENSISNGASSSNIDEEELSGFDNYNIVRRPPPDDENKSFFYRNNHYKQKKNNLHHRQNNKNRQLLNNTRERHATPLSSNSHNSNNQHQFRAAKNNAHNNGQNIIAKHKLWRWGCIMKFSVFFLVVNYLALIFLGNSHLQDNRKLEDAFFQSLATSRASFLEPQGRLHVLRERMEQRKLEEQIKVERDISIRAYKRALRTKPPRIMNHDDEGEEDLHAYYEFRLMDEEPRNPKEEMRDNGFESKLARPKDLCGSYAQEAANDNPKSFVARDVLNSKSRVLITGVLNPIGFQLALTLKEKCGVEVMAGIDPGFPNTVTHRIELLKRIQLLTTNIPKFIQPVVMPLVGLDPRPNKKKIQETKKNSITGETNLLNMKPTHIVHLSSYSVAEYQDFGGIEDDEFRNVQSPYVGPGQSADMFVIRSSHISMEQILLSLLESGQPKERPQFVYASLADLKKDREKDNLYHCRNKLVDEILADTYNTLHRIYSVGVRLPEMIYGPWGRAHTPVYDLAEAAIGYHHRQNKTHTANDTVGDFPKDYVYVEDVIEGIIAAMQYREVSQCSTLFDLSSGKMSNLTEVNDIFSRVLQTSSKYVMNTTALTSKVSSELALRTKDLLKWSVETPLPTGLAKTMAWHLDYAFPFGDRVNKDRPLCTGDEFRKRVGLEVCASHDVLCHLGRKYMPCSSECSIRKECTPSVFDEVSELVKEATEGCDIVLYTQSIGYDVQDLKLCSVYEEEGKAIICNFAFVPENSHLVRAAVDKVPENHLKSFGISPTKKDLLDSSQFKKRKTQKLNGRLLYKGWILIWLKEAEKVLTTVDNFLLKMSPGKIFHSDVKHAVYVDENFPISPKPDDVLFLVAQTHRPALPHRNVYRKEESGKKIKYSLAAEPERKAVIVVSPLKYKKVTETGEPAKISVLEATKYMQVEIGDNPEEKETSGLKKQREFYERVLGFVNRVDFRSNREAWYKYEFKNWARTRWIVHDMRLEEGRQFRCDWYQEHIQWDNNLDQLSFAHIITLREIERRIAFQEPDDHIKPAYVTHPELLHLSDDHEWHALESEENRVAFKDVPIETFSIVADHMVDKDESFEKGTEDGFVHNSNLANSQKTGLPLFVRIVSEHVMMKARQAWSVENGTNQQKKY